MTQASAGTLAAGGFDIEYACLPGTRPGPTLVLLHEGLGSVSMWRRFPDALAARTGLPVFVYSRPGYGRSSPVPLPRPLDFHTRDALDVLPAVLDAAGIGECVLVGHSDGASIAIVYAGATRDPRVRALVLMAPHVLTEDKTVANIARARDAYATTDLRARLARHHGDNVDCAFRGWCDTWLAPGFRDWNIEQWLPSITVPVLTVRGNDDAYNTEVHVDRIVAQVGGAVTRLDLAACGHAPQQDQEEGVLAAIADFVEGLRASG